MAITPDSRQMIEVMIESLIALLDAADGDCDLEDNGDFEPWIGGAIRHSRNGPECDLEFDTSDDELTGDEEPFLGWSNPLWPFQTEAPATLQHQERSA